MSIYLIRQTDRQADKEHTNIHVNESVVRVFCFACGSVGVVSSYPGEKYEMVWDLGVVPGRYLKAMGPGITRVFRASWG